MNIQLDLNDSDFVDNVTRLNILDMYKNVNSDVRSLKEFKRTNGYLPEHKVEDLSDAKKNRKALKRVLRYISTVNQFAELGID